MSGWYVCQARASGDSGLAADLTKHGQNGPRAAANQPSVSGSRATFLLLSLTKYAPNRSGKRGIRSSAREDKEGISSRVTEIDHGLFRKSVNISLIQRLLMKGASSDQPTRSSP